MPFSFTPFVDWIEDNPYYTKDSWNFEKNVWDGPGVFKLFPIQKQILSYCLYLNDRGEFPYSTLVYSCNKKSGKTSLSAAIAAWFADQAPAGTEIYIIANGQEQAEGRCMRDLKYHYKKANELSEERVARITQWQIDLENGTFIRALPSNATTAAGSRHALTLFDELWGATSEPDIRMWDEMTPIPTIPYSLRVVSTYAGFIGESSLLWQIYEQGVGPEETENGKATPVAELPDLPCWTNGRMFTYWDHEPRMPWQTYDYYYDQQKQLRPAAYLRLHENRWVTSHETFIPIEWWDMSSKHFPKPPTEMEDKPYCNYPISIGVDVGTKHDTTAVVGCTYDPEKNKSILLFHKIWKPSPDQVFDLDTTVESFLLEMYNLYNVSSIVYDPTQLYQTMVRLASKGLPVREYTQSQSNMIKASETLYTTLKYRNLMAYPDEDIKQQLQYAVAEETANGIRIVKQTRSRKNSGHIDVVIAMAMAMHDAVGRGGVDVSKPIRIESPFSDVSEWDVVNPSQFKWPEALRD